MENSSHSKIVQARRANALKANLQRRKNSKAQEQTNELNGHNQKKMNQEQL